MTNDRRRACPPAEDLSAFIDGELDSAARARLAAHLARCPACSETLKLFGAADSAAESATAAELSPELRARLELIPHGAAARRRRIGVALGAAAAVLAAAILALVLEPPGVLELRAGTTTRDGARWTADSAAELAARDGWTLALEAGAVVDVDEATGAALLVSGRARCVAPRGVEGSLRTPAGDVRFADGACEVSVEGSPPSRLDPARSTCRVLVETSGPSTEWLTPAGERLALGDGAALFREIELRSFGPSPSTAPAPGSDRSVELYVYDADGRPVGGASVRFVARNGVEAARGVTIESGRVDIPKVPLGDYRLRVEKAGVGDKELDIAVEAGESTPRSVFVQSRG